MPERPLKFNGSHYEIGKQMCRYYKLWNKKTLYTPLLQEKTYDQQFAIYKNFYPNYLDLAEGVAAGLSKDSSQVIRSLLTRPLASEKYQMRSCSIMAVTTSAGPLVGRAYDWRQSAIKSTKLYSVKYTNSSYAYDAISDMGVWRVGKPAKLSQYLFEPDDIWNEHGLFIAMNGAPGEPQSTGMQATHLVQLIAETCKTVREAINILSQVPCNEPKLFTLTDSANNIAVVEKNQTSNTRVIESNNYICVTNHFQHPEFLADNVQLLQTIPFHSTYARHAYLSLALKFHKPTSIGDIKKLMLKPPIIQDWKGTAQGDMVTVWLGLHDNSNNTHEILLAPFS